MSYPILTLLVLLLFSIFAWLMKKWINPGIFLRAGIFMLLMTALFDNLIIASGIVDYDYEKTLGLRIFLAPIEDFAYTLVALVLVPSIFNYLRTRF